MRHIMGSVTAVPISCSSRIGRALCKRTKPRHGQIFFWSTWLGMACVSESRLGKARLCHRSATKISEAGITTHDVPHMNPVQNFKQVRLGDGPP